MKRVLVLENEKPLVFYESPALGKFIGRSDLEFAVWFIKHIGHKRSQHRVSLPANGCQECTYAKL